MISPAALTGIRERMRAAGWDDDRTGYHGRFGSDVAKEFTSSRRARSFPRFEEDPLVFEGLTFYWKQPGDDDDNADET